ncbi:zinc finger CHY domain-containing protein [Bisporella sp. PMI_857]|nr:zinc finger CHY domain-containing protein [Bisporella sp. PMI_857]
MAAQPTVHGIDITSRTQCIHWYSELDIIAVRHKCCDKYYACISCHDALSSHEPTVWPKVERDAKAVLCGGCKEELTITEYLGCGSVCPKCNAKFNPGCERHYGLYFEM